MARPLSARAHEDALAATLKLITERGIDGISMDSIAESAGVSKATIYKHWPSKEALCLEAIGTLQSGLPEASHTEDARTSLVEFVRHLSEAPRPRLLARLMAKVLGHASRNPQFAKAWGERIEAPRRARLLEVIQQGVADGQLQPDVDIEVAVHLIFGSVLYHRLMRTPVPNDMPERIVHAFWKAYANSGPV